MEHLEGEQYSQYPMEGNSRGYMSMRGYRNLPWHNQQLWERNPNPPRSMRDYRDQWMSTPSYSVTPTYAPPPHPQYASLPQPQPPQPISPVEQAILDLTKLVGDDVEEQKKFNAQLSQKIHTVENSLDHTLDGLQSEMDKKIDNLHYSISRPAQQFVHQEEENLEEECLTDTILGEEAQLQLQLQEGLKEEPAEDLEELQDAPQLCVIYGPWKKEEEILPLLSEESNGKEAGEEPKKSTPQPQNSPLPVYILPSPAAQPTSGEPIGKATSIALPVLQKFKKLVAIVQAFATTSKTMAAAHTAWHSGWFGCRFGFGAPEPRHF